MVSTGVPGRSWRSETATVRSVSGFSMGQTLVMIELTVDAPTKAARRTTPICPNGMGRSVGGRGGGDGVVGR